MLSDKTCEICGNQLESIRFATVCSDACYEDKFWQEKIKNYDKHLTLIIDGEYYHYVPSEHRSRKLNGFYGRQFRIVKFNGVVIETCNLWHAGTIPDKYKSKLPNNAKFIPNK